MRSGELGAVLSSVVTRSILAARQVSSIWSCSSRSQSKQFSFCTMATVSQELRKRFCDNKQGHVFEFLDKGLLNSEQINELSEKLLEIDVEHSVSLFNGSTSKSSAAPKAGEITPVNPSEVVSKQHEDIEKARDLAFEALANGEVCFLVLSGGQGTRLGFDHPKGMYDIGLPSHKSLFRIQAERLLRLQALTARRLPNKGCPQIRWYVMTSSLNDAETRHYFKENNYFGLASDSVNFFSQNTLPCFTNEGKFILESKSTLSVAPDGNGGIYRCLESKKILDDMESHGVKYMHVSSVDNPLVLPCDPDFVGFTLLQGADVGNKGCPKAAWNEKVGVMAMKDSHYCVVEYNEIGDKLAQMTTPCGKKLSFSLGNICNHMFKLSFIRDLVIPNLHFTYHVAKKKVPYADPDTGQTLTPSQQNGIKLEMFIFDVFPLAESMTLFECTREEEFAPVKNAPGSDCDSPDTARKLIFNLAAQRLKNAGVNLVSNSEDSCSKDVAEISPLVAYRDEDLERLRGCEMKLPLLLCHETDCKESFLTVDSDGQPFHHYVRPDGLNIYVLN